LLLRGQPSTRETRFIPAQIWQEEMLMMREFGKPSTSTANIAGVRPVQAPQSLGLEERTAQDMTDQDTTGLRPFQVGKEENDESSNTAKIAGGIVMGLLLLGGGLYAYESSSRSTAPQQLALKTPASNHIAADQYPTAAPPKQDNTATPAATPPVNPTRPVRHRIIRAAENTDRNAARPAPAVRDAAINAPMTLTPESAPPPQKPQTAMQQPLTAPDVSAPSGRGAQPAPAVANNSVRTLPAERQPPIPPGQLPADRAQEPGAQ
jgi:hypothetical protein